MSMYTIKIVVSPAPGGYFAKAYRPGKSGEEWASWSWGEIPQEAVDRCKSNYIEEEARFEVEGVAPPRRRPQTNTNPRRKETVR